MYKTLFQNSKAALAFAAMTVFGAVSMVGTSEDSGLVGQAVDMIGSQRDGIASNAQAYAKGQSVGDKRGDSNWGGEAQVFGNYGSDSPATTAQGPAAPTQKVFDPAHAPLSPTAIVTSRGSTTANADPFISEREMTIEPE